MKALVFFARSLHLGYIGSYGNEWVETPALDRLAAEGVVFDQHYADQPDAAGAERAWQTGCYRFPPPTPEEDFPYQGPANNFALLSEGGIATYLVHDGKLAATPAGWQHSYFLESVGGEPVLPEQITDALCQALLRLASREQWLLRLDLGILRHFSDSLNMILESDGASEKTTCASGDALPSDEATGDDLLDPEDVAYCRLQDRYAALVEHLDAALGCVVEELERRGFLDSMLVLVTSDHGYRLGEDRTRPASRLLLHEELIHIPLILRLPGKAQAGRRIAALTQPVDILPTLFDCFGVPLSGVHGYSLLPPANGTSDRLRPYACAGLCTGDAVEWALRSPDRAFLWPVASPSSDSPLEPELYVKPEDRWEVNNVRQHHLEFTDRLEKTLRCFVTATRCPGPLQVQDLPGPEPEPVKEQEHPLDLAARSMPL